MSLEDAGFEEYPQIIQKYREELIQLAQIIVDQREFIGEDSWSIAQAGLMLISNLATVINSEAFSYFNFTASSMIFSTDENKIVGGIGVIRSLMNSYKKSEIAQLILVFNERFSNFIEVESEEIRKSVCLYYSKVVNEFVRYFKQNNVNYMKLLIEKSLNSQHADVIYYFLQICADFVRVNYNEVKDIS